MAEVNIPHATQVIDVGSPFDISNRRDFLGLPDEWIDVLVKVTLRVNQQIAVDGHAISLVKRLCLWILRLGFQTSAFYPGHTSSQIR
jgi:hypothetical protein